MAYCTCFPTAGTRLRLPRPTPKNWGGQGAGDYAGQWPKWRAFAPAALRGDSDVENGAARWSRRGESSR
jgi:hypothetical protein